MSTVSYLYSEINNNYKIYVVYVVYNEILVKLIIFKNYFNIKCYMV